MHADADAHRFEKLSLRYWTITDYFLVHLGDLGNLFEVDVRCKVEAAYLIEYCWPILDELVILDASEGVLERMVLAVVDNQSSSFGKFDESGDVFCEV